MLETGTSASCTCSSSSSDSSSSSSDADVDPLGGGSRIARPPRRPGLQRLELHELHEVRQMQAVVRLAADAAARGDGAGTALDPLGLAEPAPMNQVRRINAARGLSGLHRLRHNLFQAFVSRAGSHIVISAGVYTLLNFNATHRGNRTRVNGAAVNNAAVLGVLLADALWDALIDRRNWDFKTGEKLFFHAYCMREILGRHSAPDLKHALLSLQSTARAVAAPGWHRRALAFGYYLATTRVTAYATATFGSIYSNSSYYHLSASQVFFMLFVLHHSCQTLDLDYDDDGLSLSESIRHTGEFCNGFGCASQPQIDWATACEEPSEDRRTGLQFHLSRMRGAKAVHQPGCTHHFI
ncbi:uncharacterized protein [Dermacentor andersoni]|uniref:uncharacterized protein n=1 Tax=Dermacentor andersoni TaxID=34620 RepID=UPI0024163154|nr:uncharacterized protein LOC126523562 [Dermacentor andersoni]